MLDLIFLYNLVNKLTSSILIIYKKKFLPTKKKEKLSFSSSSKKEKRLLIKIDAIYYYVLRHTCLFSYVQCSSDCGKLKFMNAKT